MARSNTEEKLYRPVKTYLEQRFQDRVKPAYGSLRSFSAITARAGGADTGLWSKPDLCFVALWRYKYGLSWSLDVHGFEVKTLANCDLTGVHEALSHTSLVHFSHLVWEKPDWAEDDRKCADIKDRCARYGVGLITLADSGNVDSFIVRVEGRRHTPSEDAVNEFIETRLPPAQQKTLLEWIGELR